MPGSNKKKKKRMKNIDCFASLNPLYYHHHQEICFSPWELKQWPVPVPAKDVFRHLRRQRGVLRFHHDNHPENFHTFGNGKDRHAFYNCDHRRNPDRDSNLKDNFTPAETEAFGI